MEKIGSDREGLPLKKGPLRIKVQMDRCLFFSWEPGYIRHPSHGKDRVHLHFKSGRSTPKKRTPSYIWANRRIWKYPII